MVSTKYRGYRYITEDAARNLKVYSYRGADTSKLYQYILSPLAAFFVNKIVPKSMAPNTITFVGLVWMISAYLTYWWYAPSLCFEETNLDNVIEASGSFIPPRWIFLWNGICILVYQTLDNMDGKQARRTQSSNPLGLLFDHGCDAINSIFGSANVIIEMNLCPRENMFEIWVLIFAPFFVFYVTTWEHYFTGQLILPIVNGPSEGLLGTALVSFVSYWFGSQYWQQTDIFDYISYLVPTNSLLEDMNLRNCDFVVIAVLLCTFQEVILKAPALMKKYEGSTIALMPMVVLVFCFFIIGSVDPNIWLPIPRTSIHLSMVLFVEMTTALMLAHITAQPFFPWRWQIAPLIGITSWVTIFGNHGGVQFMIIAYTYSLGAYLLVKWICVVREICDVLGIWCFDIVTPYYKMKK